MLTRIAAQFQSGRVRFLAQTSQEPALLPPLILTINTGSSSLKVAAYEMNDALKCVWNISIKNIGAAVSSIEVRRADGASATHHEEVASQTAALDLTLAEFEPIVGPDRLGAVGHRLVHGGPILSAPTELSDKLVARLKKLKRWAPDHLPQAIAAIEFMRKRYPKLPEVATFDTDFHAGMPSVARDFAIPATFTEAGVHRYGFHGLSYAYVLDRMKTLYPDRARERMVIAHLGSGASMAAIRGGKSVDTSMGFAPDSGLVMGTRSGDIDAGAVLHMIDVMKMSPSKVRKLLNSRSGLLAVSTQSADMQWLLEQRELDANARHAIDMFCYRAKKYLGGYISILGGLDILIFTGGIGEKSAEIRRQICADQRFLGIDLDEQANHENAQRISRVNAAVTVLVIPTDEDLMIARATRDLLIARPFQPHNVDPR